MAKTLTFGSLKGGAGKTKVSTNVATELSLRGHKVLIIDADPQGNTTEDFGLEPAEGYSLAEILKQPLPPTPPRTLEQVILAPEDLPNLHVLPASYKVLDEAEKSLIGTAGDFAFLKKIVTPLADSYDYIIIDTPPRLGELTRAAIFAADYAIPVVGPTSATFTGALSFASQVEACQEYSPKPITTPFWVAANWKNSAESRKVQEALAEDENIKVLETILPDSKLASSAVLEYQVPVVAALGKAPFSKKVKALVDEILEEI